MSENSERRTGAQWGVILAWVGILVLWSTAIVFCIVLLGFGVSMTFTFESVREPFGEAHLGQILILGGSLGLFIGAFWAKLMYAPRWACLLVAVPGAVVLGLALFAGGSLFPQLSYILIVPIIAAGIISVLILARPVQRTSRPTPTRRSGSPQ